MFAVLWPLSHRRQVRQRLLTERAISHNPAKTRPRTFSRPRTPSSAGSTSSPTMGHNGAEIVGHMQPCLPCHGCFLPFRFSACVILANPPPPLVKLTAPPSATKRHCCFCCCCSCHHKLKYRPDICSALSRARATSTHIEPVDRHNR